MTASAYLDAPLPIAVAHRGGATYAPNVGIENSAAAFRNAVALGYSYLETDVHASTDGDVFAFHDPDLERVTGAPGLIGGLSSAQLEHALIGGREPVPRLAALLEEFVDCRFNIDVKDDRAVEPVVDVVRSCHAQDRVCLVSFSHRRLRSLRALAPDIATAFSPWEVACLRAFPLPYLRRTGLRNGGVCVQVPPHWGRLVVVTSRFVANAHALGLQVHAWTVDQPSEMARLLDLGVDGVVSDRIDLLADLLAERRRERGAR